MKKTIKLNQRELSKLISESVKRVLNLTENGNLIMPTNDGGYVTNDGYSLDSMEDLRAEREYMENEWKYFYDIDPTELINGLDGDTPLDILLHAAEKAGRNVDFKNISPFDVETGFGYIITTVNYKFHVPFAKYALEWINHYRKDNIEYINRQCDECESIIKGKCKNIKQLA